MFCLKVKDIAMAEASPNVPLQAFLSLSAHINTHKTTIQGPIVPIPAHSNTHKTNTFQSVRKSHK